MRLKLVEKPVAPLLGPEDPPAFYKVNGGGRAPVIITCDHASNIIPAKLSGLGLDPVVRDRHIAYDIGAAAVAAQLACRLDAPAIFSGYSRLVIDINRPVDDFTSIRAISDGVVIRGNRGVTAEECQRRADELFWPYHAVIAETITEKIAQGLFPAMISVHSCTDRMRGIRRPWQVGVLMNKDRRMGEALIRNLEARYPDYAIGDNKPYSGMDPYGYTIETHALPVGLPNVLLEIRQDLIRNESGQAYWAEILGAALEEVLQDRHLYQSFPARRGMD